MRRLPLVLIALPLCLVLAAPASALTPKDGTYKGSGDSTCTNVKTRKKEKCEATVTVVVAERQGQEGGHQARERVLDVRRPRRGRSRCRPRASSSLSTRPSPRTYALKGKFSSSTKLSGSYQAKTRIGDETTNFPKTTFTAKRK